MNKAIVFYLIPFLISLSVNAQIKKDTEQYTHCVVEIDASFPGGEIAWQKYLKRNFKGKVCQMPFRDSAYTQTAIIQFQIYKDGSIINVNCINSDSIYPALKNEAVKLIKNSPKWTPAQRNGRYQITNKLENISITVLPMYL